MVIKGHYAIRSAELIVWDLGRQYGVSKRALGFGVSEKEVESKIYNVKASLVFNPVFASLKCK